jgi:hypothetical protein
MAPRTFLSHPDFWRSCAVLGDLDASQRHPSVRGSTREWRRTEENIAQKPPSANRIPAGR